MKKTLLLIIGMALAIGLTSTLYAAESKLPAGMEALTKEDQTLISENWLKEFAKQTGLANLGKPKGSKAAAAEMKSDDASVRFQVSFATNPKIEEAEAEFNTYVKALFALTKSIAEKGELFIRENFTEKTVTDITQCANEYQDYKYGWYYRFGGTRWELDAFLKLRMTPDGADTIRITIDRR